MRMSVWFPQVYLDKSLRRAKTARQLMISIGYVGTGDRSFVPHLTGPRISAMRNLHRYTMIYEVSENFPT